MNTKLMHIKPDPDLLKIKTNTEKKRYLESLQIRDWHEQQAHKKIEEILNREGRWLS